VHKDNPPRTSTSVIETRFVALCMLCMQSVAQKGYGESVDLHQTTKYPAVMAQHLP